MKSSRGMIFKLILLTLPVVFIALEDPILKFFFDHVSVYQGQVVGRVISRQGDARIRPYKQLIWKSIAPSDKLYERDLVYSGSNSMVELELNNQAKVRVQPNSLVRIDTGGEGQKPRLKVSEGDLLAQAANNQSIEVVGNDNRVSKVELTNDWKSAVPPKEDPQVEMGFKENEKNIEKQVEKNVLNQPAPSSSKISNISGNQVTGLALVYLVIFAFLAWDAIKRDRT